MQNSKPGFANAVAIVLLAVISAIAALKFIPGAHMAFVNLKDKTVLYGVVAVWNACFAYVMFRIL